MTLTVSGWFYRGVTEDGGVLSIDPAYFSITGGRERWLYRVARKHAGGNGMDGFAISMPILFEKSGAEGTYRRFKFEILRIVRRNDLPAFSLSPRAGSGGSRSFTCCGESMQGRGSARVETNSETRISLQAGAGKLHSHF
jgi:plasmid replication initiation protein